MTYRVEVSSKARRLFAQANEWWSAHRPATSSLVVSTIWSMTMSDLECHARRRSAALTTMADGASRPVTRRAANLVRCDIARLAPELCHFARHGSAAPSFVSLTALRSNRYDISAESATGQPGRPSLRRVAARGVQARPAPASSPLVEGSPSSISS